jgi:hypothetical protein
MVTKNVSKNERKYSYGWLVNILIELTAQEIRAYMGER